MSPPLIGTRDLLSCRLETRDGETLPLADLYLDDSVWAIRYLVAETHHWLPHREVLLSPFALNEPDFRNSRLPIEMKRDEIERAPASETSRPVSRQYERRLHRHYGWPPYWEEPAEAHVDPHLRSARRLVGYAVTARNERVGHVGEFLLDTDSWLIRYLVVQIGTWLPGHSVLILPEVVEQVAWGEKETRIALTGAEIRGAPVYNPAEPLTRDYETGLHEHYDATPYWRREQRRAG